jgi:hypothetical protein
VTHRDRREPSCGALARRSSQNSFLHGLSSANHSFDAKQIEELARELAGQQADMRTMGYARNLARAKFDLDQVRQVRVSLLKRVLLIGRLHRSRYLLSQIDPIIFTEREMAHIDRVLQGGARLRLPKLGLSPIAST